MNGGIVVVTPGAWLDITGRYRFLLSRTWNADKASLDFVMLNPSTADAISDDPTIRRCMGFAHRWGYGGINVHNLFAYRTAKPQELWAARHRGIDIVSDHNILLSLNASHRRVVCAWGAHANAQQRATEMRGQLERAGHFLYHLGLTRDGHPTHPLYRPADTELTRWVLNGDGVSVD